MRKLVHLLKRHPGDQVADFHNTLKYLRSIDPPTASSYVQSHTLLRGYARGELLFDAVEEFAFDTREACAAFRQSEEYDVIWRRRLPAIEHHASVILEVDTYRVKDTALSEAPVKNIEFVTRRPGMALDPFRRYWRDVHGPIGSKIPSIQRYEQNHAAPEEYAGGRQPRFDGLAITWFASTQAMRDGAQSEAYEITRADEANFLPDGHLPIIITREVLDA